MDPDGRHAADACGPVLDAGRAGDADTERLRISDMSSDDDAEPEIRAPIASKKGKLNVAAAAARGKLARGGASSRAPHAPDAPGHGVAAPAAVETRRHRGSEQPNLEVYIFRRFTTGSPSDETHWLPIADFGTRIGNIVFECWVSIHVIIPFSETNATTFLVPTYRVAVGRSSGESFDSIPSIRILKTRRLRLFGAPRRGDAKVHASPGYVPYVDITVGEL